MLHCHHFSLPPSLSGVDILCESRTLHLNAIFSVACCVRFRCAETVLHSIRSLCTRLAPCRIHFALFLSLFPFALFALSGLSASRAEPNPQIERENKTETNGNDCR